MVPMAIRINILSLLQSRAVISMHSSIFTSMLKGMAHSFEAWNHNPLANAKSSQPWFLRSTRLAEDSTGI